MEQYILVIVRFAKYKRRLSILKRFIWIGLFSIIFVLSACSDNLPIETDMSENVANFSFTNQDNETVERDDLAGNWWLADFIFTNCETVCLPMTNNMAALQVELDDKGIPIQFVSFSVDPEYDQPDVLKEYAEDYDVNFDNWHFLTGYDFQTIRKLSIKSFRAPLKEPAYGSDQVTHDIRFFLVDPEGNIVKGYEGTNQATMDEIVDDLLVLNENGLL